jgi:two-component system nitrate/nitrite response regulator NarL
MTQAPASRTRILFLDDHSLFRESVSRVLNAEPDIEVAASCASVAEALDSLRSKSIDLVLLDFDLGTETGAQFLVRARERGFTGPILVVTAGMSDEDMVEVVLSGAAGIFYKHGAADMLVESIRAVMRGESWIDQRTLATLLRINAPTLRPAQLNSRERDVLRAVFQGLGNKEVASRMQMSESSIKAVLQQLFEKTGVRTRGQLVRVALERYRHLL